jgi:hypothetical protein
MQPSLFDLPSRNSPLASTTKGLDIIVKLAPAKPTIVFNTYWKFAAERQRIFFRRFAGCPQPWTTDQILQKYKFTNAYRASDRVSQYLIRNIISGKHSPADTFLRCILFKVFNKIETWELLESEVGEINTTTFNETRFDNILTKARAECRRIYSAAYIMPSGGSWVKCTYKHQMHLKLISKMLNDRLWESIGSASSMHKAFDLLRAYPTIGDFLAYQYVTDLNYSNLTNFSEMEFVIPGPGAKNGILKCFSSTGGLTETDIISYVAEHQDFFFDRLGLTFPDLWGRPLQLIDCQNLFCEVDKYSRVRHPEFSELTGRIRIKQSFNASHEMLFPVYPDKWKLDIRDLSERY